MDVASATDFAFISSPQRYSYYSSAPSSPTSLRDHQMYCEFDELLIAGVSDRDRGSHATVPFAWEEKPGVPKTPNTKLVFDDEFSFDVSCDDLGTGSVPAEDLFDGGRIKTVDPPERGREKGFSSSRFSSSRSRRTRSLSPLGVSGYRGEQQAVNTGIGTKPVSKRWSFKDFFLFRSASDGRTMEKYPLKKHVMVNRKSDDFRNNGESVSVSKRKGRVSAHELHYNLNRANSNDMKKRTYLPYKQGILG